MTASIKRIAVIGTGVIGSGWIIRFLANKKIVYVFDPNKEQKKFLLNEITRTQRSIRKLSRIFAKCLIDFPFDCFLVP